MIILGSLESA